MALTSIVSAAFVLTTVLGCACATRAVKKMEAIATIERMK
jgi:hypothetical protein